MRAIYERLNQFGTATVLMKHEPETHPSSLHTTLPLTPSPPICVLVVCARISLCKAPCDEAHSQHSLKSGSFGQSLTPECTLDSIVPVGLVGTSSSE